MKNLQKFWVLVLGERYTNSESTEEYDDFDDARADFINLSQYERDTYRYIVLQEVETNYEDYEEITELERWEDE